jgi:hypothetical protein
MAQFAGEISPANLEENPEEKVPPEKKAPGVFSY